MPSKISFTITNRTSTVFLALVPGSPLLSGSLKLDQFKSVTSFFSKKTSRSRVLVVISFYSYSAISVWTQYYFLYIIMSDSKVKPPNSQDQELADEVGAANAKDEEIQELANKSVADNENDEPKRKRQKLSPARGSTGHGARSEPAENVLGASNTATAAAPVLPTTATQTENRVEAEQEDAFSVHILNMGGTVVYAEEDAPASTTCGDLIERIERTKISPVKAKVDACASDMMEGRWRIFKADMPVTCVLNVGERREKMIELQHFEMTCGFYSSYSCFERHYVHFNFRMSTFRQTDDDGTDSVREPHSLIFDLKKCGSAGSGPSLLSIDELLVRPNGSVPGKKSHTSCLQCSGDWSLGLCGGRRDGAPMSQLDDLPWPWTGGCVFFFDEQDARALDKLFSNCDQIFTDDEGDIHTRTFKHRHDWEMKNPRQFDVDCSYVRRLQIVELAMSSTVAGQRLAGGPRSAAKDPSSSLDALRDVLRNENEAAIVSLVKEDCPLGLISNDICISGGSEGGDEDGPLPKKTTLGELATRLRREAASSNDGRITNIELHVLPLPLSDEKLEKNRLVDEKRRETENRFAQLMTRVNAELMDEFDRDPYGYC